MIAARLLGIREFSLAALVEQLFGVGLTKGSQKANWAQRPLPNRMMEYAIIDTHYLLPLAEKLKADVKGKASRNGSIDPASAAWRRSQSIGCAIPRKRGGSAVPARLRGRAAAVLRALWHWREGEARTAERPPFHILQNHLLLQAAKDFEAGKTPEFRHLTPRRRRFFQEAAEQAMEVPDEVLPRRVRRGGSRPTQEMERAPENTGAVATWPRKNWDWSRRLSRQERRWNPSRRTRRAVPLCLSPGNATC